MSPALAFGIAVLALFALIAIEVPIAIALIGTGVVGILLLGEGIPDVTNIIGAVPYSSTAKYTLFVIPMYILLGSLISNAGIGAAVYRSVNRLIGRLPGGLGMTAVLATTLFSGISGSSAADVAAFGKMSVREMVRHGYKPEYSAAIVAAAGAFAALIPPAIAFVIYGVATDTSIGALIFAGIIPGILSCVILALYVFLRAVYSGRKGIPEYGGVQRRVPAAPAAGGELLVTPAPLPDAGSRRIFSMDFLRDSVGILYAAIIFLIVVGGLNGGFFTATEAGAFGALAALVMVLIARNLRTDPLRKVLSFALRESVSTTSMIFLLLVGGATFGYMIALSGAAGQITTWINGINVAPILIVAAFLIMLLLLGMVLEGMTIMLITAPIMAPIVAGFGFDAVWFGVLVIKMIEIGLITPPVGLNAFIVSAATKTRPEGVLRHLVPFVVLDLIITAIFFIFPDIILWLPRMAGLIA